MPKSGLNYRRPKGFPQRGGYTSPGITLIIADFSADVLSGVCPLIVQFTDDSIGNPTGWLWDFGDGNTSDEQNPSHQYIVPGTYTVSLTASKTGSSDSITKTNYITATEYVPPINAAFHANIFSGDYPLSVNFTDDSTGSPVVWSWSFGDGGTSALQNPSHIYTAEGTYTVTLIASKPGSTDTEIKIAYITVSAPAPAVVANFTADVVSGDAPLTVNFTDTSSGSPVTWLWDFGDTSSSTLQNPIHEYSSAGTYTVTLTASKPGSSDDEVKTNYITVTEAEVPAFDGTIESYATIVNSSMYIRPLPTACVAGRFYYRVNGESTWVQGRDPIECVANSLLESRDGQGAYEDLDVVLTEEGAMIRRFHASARNLTPETLYDLKIELLDSGNNILSVATTTATTKSESLTYGTGTTRRYPSGGYGSIQAAFNACSAGDILIIEAGNYYEQLYVNKSGTVGQPITIRGEGTAVFANNGVVSIPVQITDGVHDINFEYLDFDGLHINSPHRREHILAQGKEFTRICFDNCDFTSAAVADTAYFIFWETWNRGAGPGFVDCRIQNCSFTATGAMASTSKPLYIDHGKGLIFWNNTINVGSCEDVVAIRRGPHKDFDIYENTITGNPTDDGMECEGGVNINVRIWNNTFNFDGGQRASISHTPVLVGPIYADHNTIYGAEQFIKCASNLVISYIQQGYSPADFGPIYYENNTFYAKSSKWSTHQFLRYNRLCHINLILKNNLIYGDRLDQEAGYYTTISRTSENWGQLDFDYNIWWDGNGTNPNAAYDLDLHSLFQDPLLVSSSWPNPDVHLQAGSPAIDAGIEITQVTEGYLGDAPDLGRYEKA
jgi:PKD repeat protein